MTVFSSMSAISILVSIASLMEGALQIAQPLGNTAASGPSVPFTRMLSGVGLMLVLTGLAFWVFLKGNGKQFLTRLKFPETNRLGEGFSITQMRRLSTNGDAVLIKWDEREFLIVSSFGHAIVLAERPAPTVNDSADA